jgi:hypothetical protein
MEMNPEPISGLPKGDARGYSLGFRPFKSAPKGRGHGNFSRLLFYISFILLTIR